MKKKYLPVIPVFVALMIIAGIQTCKIRQYYDEVLNFARLIHDNTENKAQEENQEAAKAEEEYQKLLENQKDGDIFSQGSGQQLTKQEEPEAGREISGEEILIPELRLNAISALLLDAENNRVLYDKNGTQEMPMASTTKIMTCIVALENAKPDEIVEVSAYAAKMPDVQLNIRAGEQYYLGDLLYSLMLESHNDVAVAIAEHVGGTVEGFATMMNDKARSLGCYHTNFVTPNGLDASGHYTTAKELAVIASYAIKNDRFIQITNTASHTFREIKKGRQFSVSNKNRFLYMMEGAIGVKTGFTGGAGYCFVGAVKRSDRTLVSVVLGCGWPPKKSLKWSDTKELMTYGIENYEEQQYFLQKKPASLLVKNGQKRYENLICEDNIKLLTRKDEKITVDFELPDFLQAPVKENSVVGKVEYYINNELFMEMPVYAVEEIKKINFKFCFNRVIHLWKGWYRLTETE